MREVTGFLSALWTQSKWVLTSSGLAAGVLVYEHFAHAIQAIWFWPVLLVAFLWSSFRAWAHEHRTRRALEAASLGAAPQLLVEYDPPGIQHNPEHLRIRNVSTVPPTTFSLPRSRGLT
jgi:hypothetical protein